MTRSIKLKDGIEVQIDHLCFAPWHFVVTKIDAKKNAFWATDLCDEAQTYKLKISDFKWRSKWFGKGFWTSI